MLWNISGPDCPNELLQAAEEGDLVLFCGAGVSYPAGLPDFKRLVDRIYGICRVEPDELERFELEKNNYDRVLTLLERRIAARDQPSNFVRRAVVEALEINPASANLTTHKALLDIATAPEGACRLVTTNFDRGFDYARAGQIRIDCAPKLPVPKKATWRSVVHLHGRFSDDDPSGDSMVLTSADFGLAYLTEQWAARFVSELFRRFTVLFVGYSIEDVVVRYMMDALAADRKLGEGVGTAYAMVGYQSGERDKQRLLWEAKGVIPIPYDDSDGHKALHESLSAWASCHRQGLLGKESIVVHYAGNPPTKPFESDPAVSQMLLAIGQEDGNIATRFATSEPLPPIQWLEVFDTAGLMTKAPSAAAIDALPIADNGYKTRLPARLHPVTAGLVRWLARHLDKRELLTWFLEKGGHLHPEVQEVFRWALRRAEYPIPRGLRTVWDILCLNRSAKSDRFFEVEQQVRENEWNPVLKRQFLGALTPRLVLRPPYLASILRDPDAAPNERVRDFVEAEVEVEAEQQARGLAEAVRAAQRNDEILAELVDELTTKLRDAFDLLNLVEKANSDWDTSYSDQPSIIENEQNHNFQSWTHVLELLRDGWLALAQSDPAAARATTERWKRINYPIFRRLVLFAIAETPLFAPRDALNYLLAAGENLLWSAYIGRERFRAVLSVLPRLDTDGVDLAFASILSGPPATLFRGDLTADEVTTAVDREVWTWLTRLQAAGSTVPQQALDRLEELRAKYPQWGPATTEQAEFTVWMEDAGWGDPAVADEEEFAAMSDEEVARRLGSVPIAKDDLPKWRYLCRTVPERSLDILSLAGAAPLSANLIEPLLGVFAAEAPMLPQLPRLQQILSPVADECIRQLLSQVSDMLRQVSETVAMDVEDAFFAIWDQCQPVAFTDVTTDTAVDDALFRALNSPSGALTQALLARFVARNPQQPADVPDALWNRATAIARGATVSHQIGKVLLASRLSWLHTLNRPWADAYMIPQFSWSGNENAAWIWQGFLWQPRLSPALWSSLKGEFGTTLRSSDRLSKAGKRAFQLFAIICLSQPDWISPAEIREWLRAIPADGRAEFAEVLFRNLAAAKERAETLWTERIRVIIREAWPKDVNLRDGQSAVSLALVAACSGTTFPDAAQEVLPFLTPHNYPSVLVEKLLANPAATQRPDILLSLLERAVGDAWRPPGVELRQLLDAIGEKDPTLRDRAAFRLLDEHLRNFRL